MKKEKMKIEIWSDIACPYCYIGKRKLESALSQFPQKDNVELVWHSYELNPDLPKKALEKSFYEYFAETHEISIEQAKDSMREVIKLAAEVGLYYDFDHLVVANTSDALRLVKLAKESGLATEMEEVLFDAYFAQGKDISNTTTLTDLGVKVGLKKEVLEPLLAGDRFFDEIKKDIEFSENTLNLEYIPFYLFNNKHMIEGSIAPQEYLQILTKSYAEWEKYGVSENIGGDVISGQSCSIGGVCN